jgi:hypothetical protein
LEKKQRQSRRKAEKTKSKSAKRWKNEVRIFSGLQNLVKTPSLIFRYVGLKKENKSQCKNTAGYMREG